jgi:hypothetical protein
MYRESVMVAIEYVGLVICVLSLAGNLAVRLIERNRRRG